MLLEAGHSRGLVSARLPPHPPLDLVCDPEARKFEAQGSHRKLYRFSLDDYKAVASIWNGPSPDRSGPLEFVDGPPQGGESG
jgi:Mn-containing catalase